MVSVLNGVLSYHHFHNQKMAAFFFSLRTAVASSQGSRAPRRRPTRPASAAASSTTSPTPRPAVCAGVPLGVAKPVPRGGARLLLSLPPSVPPSSAGQRDRPKRGASSQPAPDQVPLLRPCERSRPSVGSGSSFFIYFIHPPSRAVLKRQESCFFLFI